MRRTEKQQTKRRLLLKRVPVIALMIAVLATLLSLTVFAQNRYLITDGERVQVHKSYSSNPDEVLNEVGIELGEEDTYTTTYHDGTNCIKIQRQQDITVVLHGEKMECTSYGEPVEELLSSLGIALEAQDVLSCSEKAPTCEGMVIEIIRREVKTETFQESIPFTTSCYEDPELPAGEQLVLIAGVNGSADVTAEVTYENGAEVSRRILSQKILTEPVTELVVRGSTISITAQPHEVGAAPRDESKPISPDVTALSSPSVGETQTPTAPTEAEPSGELTVEEDVLTTAYGTTYRFTQALTVSCTAYSCGDRVGYTYSGTVARVGAVAVDPRYIPLGTKMYIVSNDGCYIYGYCVAEDIGGGIKGLKIDLYFDTFDECWQFGVRECTAYILE